MIVIGPARLFARTHGYRINADQELVALGGANLAAGAFQGFSVGSSLSKSAANDRAGARLGDRCRRNPGHHDAATRTRDDVSLHLARVHHMSRGVIERAGVLDLIGPARVHARVYDAVASIVSTAPDDFDPALVRRFRRT